MKFAVFTVCALVAVCGPTLTSGEDHHDHEHESCGCAAKEYDFTINCEDTTPVTAAFAALEDGCTKELCASSKHDDEHDGHDHRRRAEKECYKNYLILQSHHDHCLHSDLLENEEKEFHKYLTMCGEGCETARKPDPAYSACPEVNCTKAEADSAVALASSNNCSSSCTSTACGDAYKKLKYLHDNCVEEVHLIVGEPIHDYEEKCEDAAQGCNTAAGDADPNVCESSAVSVSASILAVFAAALALVAM